MDRDSFLQKVRTTITENQLFSIEHDTILVGVSGGVDSISLIQALIDLKCSVAIAHCNFNLRGDESDGDQAFVENFAKKHSIPIHIRSFNTIDYANERKVSIEMAARDLRYEWFNTLCTLHEYSNIAIAHNQNDSIETFFINLMRASGLKGLSGIPIKNGKIVRPFSTISRAEIEEFAHLSNLSYRIDSSNLTNDYVRNKIRNIILPELQKISSNSLNSISESIDFLRESYSIYNQAIDNVRSKVCCETESGFYIDEKKLLTHVNAKTILFEIMHPFGFNTDVISQMMQAFSSQSGKKFESATHTAIHDRDKLFVTKITKKKQLKVSIFQTDTTIALNDLNLTICCFDIKDFSLQRDASVAALDVQKLQFPLMLRYWQQGDSFIPFGMKGRKKVSDFLTDIKVPLHKKDTVLVLESAGEIVWVVGYRISDSFAVTNSTQNVYVVRIAE